MVCDNVGAIAAEAEEVEPLNEEQLAAFEDSYAADPAFYEALYPLVSERETSLTVMIELALESAIRF